jgi:ferric-dicitrate binding protein FerR (iron transport regulator)
MSDTLITFDDFSSSKRRQRKLTLGAVFIGLVLAVWLVANFISLEPTAAVSPDILAKVTRLEGKVMIKRGAETVEFEPDMSVLAGDAFITIGRAELEVTYLDDGTKALLGSDTSLLFNGSVGGKRTNLSAGTVRFEVDRQPKGFPMVLASYNAEATLLEPGIYFQSYTNSGTRFDVEEGSLVARRYSDGQTDTVTAGDTHTCRTDETEIIQFRPDGLD